jgi:PKD repeat protein
VKKKRNDTGLKELFRRKLDNSRVVPDASVNTKLMRKLAIREFMSFIPGRFNIWYLGGIMIAGIIVTKILLSDNANSERPAPQNISNEFNNLTKPINPVSTDNQIITKSPDSIKEKVTGSQKSVQSFKSGSVAEKVIQPVGLREINTVKPAETSETIAEREFFTEKSKGNMKLVEPPVKSELLIESSVSEGCIPLKVRFSTNLSGYDSCRWIFGDGGSSISRNPEWIFDIEGEYKVALEVYGADGSLETSSKIITVYPKPLARFEISPENAVLPDDEIRFINFSANAIKYNWDFGDGNTSEMFEPLHRYDGFGNYNVRLVASSENGCSDSLIVVNAFNSSEYFINFPNAFILNSDGPTGGAYSAKSDETAQIFHPVFNGVSEYQLKIFSKIGRLIFESNDVNIGWDGYFNGQLSVPGVYIWKVRGNFRNGEPFIKMGDVTLLKN